MKIYDLIWPQDRIEHIACSIQELADFWDVHDLTDFEDQLEEIKGPVFERETVLNISFEPEEAEAVKQIARSRGISYAQLVKEWVLERIHESKIPYHHTISKNYSP